MAELQNERCEGSEAVDIHYKDTMEEVSQGSKRLLNRTPSPEPPPKSPRTSSPQPDFPSLGEDVKPEEGNSGGAEDGGGERMMQDAVGSDPVPQSRRKSWRRSTRGRRSLPALHNTSHTLCKSISQDLPDEERLEKLMEAAMQLTVKRLENSLRTVPGADMEALQANVDFLQTEWTKQAKSINEENSAALTKSSDPTIQKAIERVQEAISRLQAESSSWESLLNKHRSKSEELAKRVEQGQERGVALDPACLTRSSQSKLILSKPDYHAVLSRQHKVLNTMELVLDSQCMMLRGLLSFQEHSQLLVKETSARLAQSAGFQDLPSSPIKQLLNVPLSATSS